MQNKIQQRLRWILLSVLSGLLAGLAATLFLTTLRWATETRDQHPAVIWFLPLSGFFIGWVYHRYGREISAGHNLILDEIHNPQKVIPISMAPLILLSTVITHLFGGSAGREGTAVQMGASLSDQLSRIFKVESQERKILLVAGAGAGFGAAIGTPFAGVIFGMEVIRVGRLKIFAWLECLVASLTAYGVSRILQAPHSVFPAIEAAPFDLKIFLFVAGAGIIFGLTANFFARLTHLIEKIETKFISYSPLKPFFGGILLILFYLAEGSYRYVGLGIPYIQESLVHPATFSDPIFKLAFTALTIGSGFKGGEFIPLVFIGATLGSALSLWLPVSFSLLAAVGFAAVFAGAANTPIACTVMAIEIFGWPIAPYALVACFVSYCFSGKKGIYKNQRRD